MVILNMNILETMKKLRTEIALAKGLIKGNKTFIKLGGEKVDCTCVSDGNTIYTELTVNDISYVGNGVYKRSCYKYVVPDGKFVSPGINVRNVIELYGEYLVDSSDEYVDANGNKVNFDESEKLSGPVK